MVNGAGEANAVVGVDIDIGGFFVIFVSSIVGVVNVVVVVVVVA